MAGVSPTAVSFVINNKAGISEETKKKVNEVIERTNFKPSVNSRRLFFKKSFNISIAIRQTSSPFEDLFYFEIAKGMLTKSKEYGYNIVFTEISVQGNSVILPQIIEFKDTDGVIFLQDTENAVLNRLDELEIPYVVVDAHGAAEEVTTVNADYALSAYTAVKFLLNHGHRDIAFISSSFIPEFYMQVFDGYRRALEENQISIPSYWIQTNASDEQSSFRSMEKILGGEHCPTAVFCATDLLAIGAMKCCKDKGYILPRDISFIAIDDIFLSRYIEPNLTTVKIDTSLMGSLAMELVMKKINGETVESAVVKSDHIVVRDSVANICRLENENDEQS